MEYLPDAQRRQILESLSIKWAFLRVVLLEFGFLLKFVNLVMECVTTVQYAFIHNGDLTPTLQAKED